MNKKAPLEKDGPVLELRTADGLQLVNAGRVIFVKAQSIKSEDKKKRIDRYCQCAYYPEGSMTVRTVRLMRQTIADFEKKAADRLDPVKRGQLVNPQHVEGFGKNGAILFHAWELNGTCAVRRQMREEFQERVRALRRG